MTDTNTDIVARLRGVIARAQKEIHTFERTGAATASELVVAGLQAATEIEGLRKERDEAVEEERQLRVEMAARIEDWRSMAESANVRTVAAEAKLAELETDRADLLRALGNMLMLNVVREAAKTQAPLWLDDADNVFARVNAADGDRRARASLSPKGT